MGDALLDYAEQHDGRFPQRLSDLAPDFLPSKDDPVITYHDPHSKGQYDWLYVRPSPLYGLSPDTILVAVPMAYFAKGATGKRLVLFRNGRIQWTEDSDFRIQFRRQLLNTFQ